MKKRLSKCEILKEAELILALEAYVDTAGEALEKPPFEKAAPEGLYKRLRKADEHKQRIQRAKHGANIAAACLSVILLTGILCFACVTDVRQFVFDVFADDFALLNCAECIVISTDMNKPTYIPEGFDYVHYSSNDFSGFYSIDYGDGSRIYTVTQQRAESANLYDYVEPVNEEAVSIKNAAGLYWEEEGIKSLAWMADGNVYTITGGLERGDLLQIARSMPA